MRAGTTGIRLPRRSIFRGHDMTSATNHERSEARVARIADELSRRFDLDGATYEYEDDRQWAIADILAAARATHGLDDAQADYLRGILRDAIPRVAE